MFGHSFYHGSIRRYVTLFGTLFNDIHINRGTTTSIKVPIAYSPRDKALARINGDPSFDRPAVILPRMAFEITSFNYDGDRKLNTLTRHAAVDTTDAPRLKYQYVPVPYNIGFDLNIFVKNTEDGTQIIEQILPFFTPEWTATVNLVPEMSITKDIPTVLTSVNMSDNYEGDFETRRTITWTLSFTMKAFLFGPVNKSKIITFANTSITDYTVATANTLLSNVTVAPGLDANGNPTSNGAASISASSIYPDDDFGYVVTIS